MIYILPKLNDLSSDLIAFWLRKFDQNVLILSDYKMLINLLELNEIDNSLLFIRSHTINNLILSNEIELYKIQIQEIQSTEEYICHLISGSNCKLIGNIKKESNNKLIQANLAKTLGLSTPKFFIKNQYTENLEVVPKNRITKPLTKGLVIFRNTEYYISYTSRIDDDFIRKEMDFFPSLIQEEIEKEFEVRMLFLGT